MTVAITPTLLTRRQAAEVLAISERTLFSFTKNGELPSVRLGTRSVRYRPEDLDRFAARRLGIAK